MLEHSSEKAKLLYANNVNVKAAENQNFPAFILYFPAERFSYQNSTALQVSLEIFSAKVLTSYHKNKSRNMLILNGFDVHFTSYSVQMSNMRTYYRQA
jgi:hypothetical protein